MDALIQDLRGALRTLRKSKGTPMVVLATLATGIATVTTIFSFVNSALLHDAQERDRSVGPSYVF